MGGDYVPLLGTRNLGSRERPLSEIDTIDMSSDMPSALLQGHVPLFSFAQSDWAAPDADGRLVSAGFFGYLHTPHKKRNRGLQWALGNK